MTALLGLVTAVTWAFSNLFTHRLSRLEIEFPVVVAGILGVATAALVPLALIVDRGEGPWTATALAWPVVGGISATAGLFLLVRALSVGSLSVVAPIIAVEGGIAAALSVALGERPSAAQVAMMAVAIVGAVLVSMGPGNRTAAGAIPAALGAFAYAVAWVAIGMSELPSMTTIAVQRGTSLVLVLPLVLLLCSSRIPPRASLAPFLWCGLLDAAGYVTFALATAVGSIAVASVAATQWTTAAAVIGIVILKERLQRIQYVGVVVTLAAVSALVLLS